MPIRLVAEYRADGRRPSKYNRDEALSRILDEARRICRDFEDNANFPVYITLTNDVERGAWVATLEMVFHHYDCFRRRECVEE